jgi:short-subunit dehydrogenase
MNMADTRFVDRYGPWALVAGASEGVGAAYARAGDRENAIQYLREGRAKAQSRGQLQLVASIERDLKILSSQADSH